MLTINAYLSRNCTNYYGTVTKNAYECKVGTINDDDDYDDDDDDTASKDVMKAAYESVTSSRSSISSSLKRRKLAAIPIDTSASYEYSSLACVQEHPSGTDGYVFYQYYTGSYE